MGMPMLSAQVDELSMKVDKLRLAESQPAGVLSASVMKLSVGVNEFLVNLVHQLRTPTPNIDASTQALLNNLQASHVYVCIGVEYLNMNPCHLVTYGFTSLCMYAFHSVWIHVVLNGSMWYHMNPCECHCTQGVLHAAKQTEASVMHIAEKINKARAAAEAVPTSAAESLSHVRAPAASSAAALEGSSALMGSTACSSLGGCGGSLCGGCLGGSGGFNAGCFGAQPSCMGGFFGGGSCAGSSSAGFLGGGSCAGSSSAGFLGGGGLLGAGSSYSGGPGYSADLRFGSASVLPLPKPLPSAGGTGADGEDDEEDDPDEAKAPPCKNLRYLPNSAEKQCWEGTCNITVLESGVCHP